MRKLDRNQTQCAAAVQPADPGTNLAVFTADRRCAFVPGWRPGRPIPSNTNTTTTTAKFAVPVPFFPSVNHSRFRLEYTVGPGTRPGKLSLLVNGTDVDPAWLGSMVSLRCPSSSTSSVGSRTPNAKSRQPCRGLIGSVSNCAQMSMGHDACVSVWWSDSGVGMGMRGESGGGMGMGMGIEMGGGLRERASATLSGVAGGRAPLRLRSSALACDLTRCHGSSRPLCAP